MIWRAFLLGVLAAAFPFGMGYCQSGVAVELGVSPHPEVVLVKVGPESGVPTAITRDFPNLGSLGFYVLNNSEKPIVALVVTWTVESVNGSRKTYKFTSDSFLDIQAHPVIDAGSELFIAPRLWIPADKLPTLSAEFLKARKPGLARTEALFGSAHRVNVLVDVLIFSDGQVFGPDETLFDRELIDRKQAAEDVVHLVEGAESRGFSSSSELKKLVSTPRYKSDRRAFWRHRFAQQLLHSRDFRANLTYLKSLPMVPQLKRGFIK